MVREVERQAEDRVRGPEHQLAQIELAHDLVAAAPVSEHGDSRRRGRKRRSGGARVVGAGLQRLPFWGVEPEIPLRHVGIVQARDSDLDTAAVGLASSRGL